LLLPVDTVVDTTTNSTYGNILPMVPGSGVVDLTFNPSGQASIAGGRTMGTVIFWVRGTQPGDTEQTLVVVYTTTGMIAAHPVGTSGADPYSFTRDGRASGL
jgi:hypothetical protein